mmetsp:Transcript_42623/g.107766  ORF Transcript_42623/g.107766 Transcript_42623/m.107766 type:complete len:402 (-) Transcript_42623:163-1368(-)
MHKEALRARAVLAAGLVGAAQRGGHRLRQVGIVADNKRVLAAELEHDRGQRGGGCFHHLLADGGGAHKDELVHAASDECVAGLAVAGHNLHQVGRRVARGQRRGNHAAVVLGAPGGVLAHLDDDGVAGHDGGGERVEHVVEGIVPRHDGAHHAHGMVLHVRGLVEHHDTGAAALRAQPLLTLRAQPLDLLARDDELPKAGVYHRLARVARRHAADRLLLGQDELEQRAQQPAAVREARLPPRAACGARGGNLGLHLRGAHRWHLAKELHGAGVVAGDDARLGGRAGRVVQRRVDLVLRFVRLRLNLDRRHVPLAPSQQERQHKVGGRGVEEQQNGGRDRVRRQACGHRWRHPRHGAQPGQGRLLHRAQRQRHVLVGQCHARVAAQPINRAIHRSRLRGSAG